MSTQATWLSPTGQEFTGTPEYIVGVKAGWDAHNPTRVLDKCLRLFELVKDIADERTARQCIELLMHPLVIAPAHPCKYSALCEGRR